MAQSSLNFGNRFVFQYRTHLHRMNPNIRIYLLYEVTLSKTIDVIASDLTTNSHICA
jgi:hypothetical protein